MKPAVLLPCVIVSSLGACTTLGPMPATTAISAVPAGRAGVEAQAGLVPGFMLSDATHAPRGQSLGQLSGLVDTGQGGVILGARVAGGGGSITEPFVGIRRLIDPTIAVAGIVFGTHASGTDRFASYEASRFGGEAAIDASVLTSKWVALHAQAAVSITGLAAQGQYCVDGEGKGIDCNGDANDRVVDATLSGAYVAGTGGLSLDLFRDANSAIHLVRLAALVTAGAMPRVRDGRQEKGDAYVSGGLTLTLGVGQ